MLTAAKYLGSVGMGATAPRFFRDETGEVYVVKLQQNPLGPKVLANEILAAMIGKKLGLCFPDADTIIIKNGRFKGLHFACRYLIGTKYLSQQNIQQAKNISEMAGVMLFDHMFFNLDRTYNRKNLLIKREAGIPRIYAIDHSHLFRRGLWNKDLLEELADKIVVNNRRLYGILLKHYLSPSDFTAYIEGVKKLTNSDIQKIINQIPEEWLPNVEERKTLAFYIIRRCKLVDDITAEICKLISDKHRRTHIN